MKRPRVLLALIAIVAGAASVAWGLAAGASTRKTTRQSSGFLLLPPAAPAGQQVLYGHIKSLSVKNGHLELRFDPALFLAA